MVSRVDIDAVSHASVGVDVDAVPRLPAFYVRRSALPLPQQTPHDDAEGPVVVLVSASAGSGKTSLMAWWAHQVGATGAMLGWLTVGSEDDDACALWISILKSLMAASRTAQGSPGNVSSHQDLASITPPRVPERSFARQVAQIVGRWEAPVWLFLDDIHVVSSSSSRSVLRHLLQEAPPNLHLVLGSRADPLIGLSRLRLQGRVRDIRDADLRFSAQEAEELLLGHGLRLQRPDFDRLLRLTEGWAAGLRLAALSLADGRDADVFLTSLEEGDRSMAGYLVDEVISSFDGDTIAFLKDTCLPSVLTAAQAAELSGRPDADAVLARLADASALVVRIDAVTGRYRYHSLLRSYLAAELRRTDPQRSARQHARTAHWLLAEGDVGEALDHAVRSDDPDLVHAVMRDVGLGLIMAGRPQVVQKAVARATLNRNDPVVAAVGALAHLETGELDQADRKLSVVVDASVLTSSAEPIDVIEESEQRLVRLVLLHRDCVRGSFNSGRVALEGLMAWAERYSPGQTFASTRALRDLEIAEKATLGLALSLGGPPERGEELLRSALTEARADGRDLVAMHCLVTLSVLAARTGDLIAMERWAHASIDFAVPRGWSMAPQLAFAYTLAAAAAFEHFDVVTAAALSERALQTSSGAGFGDADAPRVPDQASVRSALAVKSYLAFDDADSIARRRILDQRMLDVEELGSHPFPPSMIAYELGEFQGMALEVGDLEFAARAVDLADRLLGDVGDVRVLRAALQLHQGLRDEARAVLEPVTEGTCEPVVVTSRTTAWLLSACIASRNGQPAVAHEALATALELAAPRRLVRLMLGVAPDVLLLLETGRGRFGRQESFAEEVLNAAARRSASSARQRAVNRPLTATELSLLRDLPSMLNLPELARARQVSPNTIKTQIRSIFTKLEVNSRREAVEVSRQLGLL